MSENYLNKIINSKEKLTGELGREQEAYLEFISGTWKTEPEEIIKKIIVFKPDSFGEDNLSTGGMQLTTFAADSGETSKYKSDTYFYISEDDDFALKIDEKAVQEDSTLTASIISEDSKDISNSILYCPETNKYFINNPKNEIILSGFKNFDYRKFTFNLIPPKVMILFVMPKGADQYTALTLDKDYIVNKLTMNNGEMIIGLEKSEGIKTVIMKSSKYKDFVTLNKNEIIIPKALTESKFELLIY